MPLNLGHISFIIRIIMNTLALGAIQTCRRSLNRLTLIGKNLRKHKTMFNEYCIIAVER